MLALMGAHMDSLGTSVDYSAMKTSEKYRDYCALVKKLNHVDLKALDSSAKKAFLVNIYNCLVIHGLVEGLLSSFPGGTISRLTFYAKVIHIFLRCRMV